MALVGFCAAVKRTTERTTERYIAYKKQRRLQQQLRFAAMVRHA
jgi:hypothetical protein